MYLLVWIVEIEQQNSSCFCDDVYHEQTMWNRLQTPTHSLRQTSVYLTKWSFPSLIKNKITIFYCQIQITILNDFFFLTFFPFYSFR